jgi:hypothetical protein
LLNEIDILNKNLILKNQSLEKLKNDLENKTDE